MFNEGTHFIAMLDESDITSKAITTMIASYIVNNPKSIVEVFSRIDGEKEKRSNALRVLSEVFKLSTSMIEKNPQLRYVRN
jgi:CII-binding regulator of phage lambda lysogenization HflD